MPALIIGPAEQIALSDLHDLAFKRPVDMPTLMESIKTPSGKAVHMAQMTEQSVELPVGYVVTFSIEDGHPVGRCRHMSMSVNRENKLPNEYVVWAIAEILGFNGMLSDCAVWLEDLKQGQAVNVVEPIEA